MGGVGLADREHLHVETRAQWRDWLDRHHAHSPGVWVVTWKRATGRPAPTYDDVVEEALCFGWIDSTAGTVDDERSKVYCAPRKPGSAWSRSNKERLSRLVPAGLMTPAGLAKVAAAEADGSWTLLDDVEALVVPPDLAAALGSRPGARAQWDAFLPGARKQMLWWVVQARRPATREARVAAVAEAAARGERAR